MALGFPFGFRVANPEPLDAKYGPHASIAAVLASVLAGERFVGLTVNVNGTEYWWKEGIADNQLIEKIVSKARKLHSENIAGDVVIDLSLGELFILTLTANVTSFSFVNEIVGMDYVLMFKQDTAYKTLTWEVGKFSFPFANAPTLTDPTANGTAPATSKDIVTALCTEAGKLEIVVTPDLQNN